ncbi:hypothetical protein BH23PAT2_BH23PAT2_10450 [soil metagenome]
MGMFDDMKNKGQDVMNDPDKRARVEQMAQEQDISIDEAKQRFMNQEEGQS